MATTSSEELIKSVLENEKLKIELNHWKERCEFFEAEYKKLNELIQGGEYDVIKENKPEKELMEIKTISFQEIISQAIKHPQQILSITIEDSIAKLYDDSFKSRIELKNVRKIVINDFKKYWRNFFNSCTFPEVEEVEIRNRLRYDESEDNDDEWIKKHMVINNIEAIFSGMGNLKRLLIRHINDVPYASINLSMLEVADVNYFYSFLQRSRETLKKLKIVSARLSVAAGESNNLISIYKNFKNIKELTMIVYSTEDCRNALIPMNESVTVLNIHVDFLNYLQEDEIEQAENLRTLEKILIASPSVETLILYEKITSHLIQFVASNMMNLVKLICRGGIDEGVLEEYRQLQEIEENNDEINTNFKIILDNFNTYPNIFEY